MITRPDYGIDAPGVQRNLFVGGAILLLGFAAIKFGLWSGAVGIPLGDGQLRVDLTGLCLVMGASFLTMGVWLLWGSKIGKLRERDSMLGMLRWSGREQVLDIGCGRGLLLIGAAKRLAEGKATGIDLWHSEDLSDNRPEAVRANAQAEGVTDRIEILTGDMRALPFPDASFDVVVSRAAIHNVYQQEERARVIAEAARVLKPGGRAVIADIRHGSQYWREFERSGCSVASYGSPLWRFLAMLFSFGGMRPVQIIATKDA